MTENAQKVLKRALNMIAYAPNTEAGLRRKLREKGAAASDIDAAVAYLKDKGYLDEAEYLFRFVATLGNSRCYGKRRIFAAAKEKGFCAEVLEEHFDTACEAVDFVAGCRTQIRKKNTGDGEKLIAALLRCGFDYGVIKEALLAEQEDCDE